MAERILPKIEVPSYAVYDPKVFTSEDVNYGARVIIKPTGILGRGKPIFFGVAELVSDIKPPLKSKLITQPTRMWFADGDGPADKMVKGHLVEEVLIVPVRPKNTEESSL